MARKRKNPADNWMPSRVRRGKSAFEFLTPDGRTIRLCDFSFTQAKVWVAYEKLLLSYKNEETLAALFNKIVAE